MKLHIHFNNHFEDGTKQACGLKETLEVGQTATIHVHHAPEQCRICPNGHCHAPNISISRIDEEQVFVALEDMYSDLECDIKDLPPHQFPDH